jgi:hypothetical protein
VLSVSSATVDAWVPHLPSNQGPPLALKWLRGQPYAIGALYLSQKPSQPSAAVRKTLL